MVPSWTPCLMLLSLGRRGGRGGGWGEEAVLCLWPDSRLAGPGTAPRTQPEPPSWAEVASSHSQTRADALSLGMMMPLRIWD